MDPENILIDVIALSNRVCIHPIKGQLAYASKENFLGRVVTGYQPDALEACLLTRKAAEQLCLVQNELVNQGLSLFIFDAFRPLRAVQDFSSWYHEPAACECQQPRPKGRGLGGNSLSPELTGLSSE